MEETAVEIAISAAFDKYDADGSHLIDVSELGKLATDLDSPFEGEHELNEAIRVLDTDASGQISKDEFVAWWRRTKAAGTTLMLGAGSAIEAKLSKLAEEGVTRHYVDIHAAAWNGDARVVEQFLKVNREFASSQDETEFGDRNTPLHYAAYNGHLEVCKLLVDAAAPVEISNTSGCTPLFFASQQDHPKVVEFLLGHLADPCAKESTHGLTPIDVAASEEIDKILTGPGSSVSCKAPRPPENPVVKQSGPNILVSWEAPSQSFEHGVMIPSITGYQLTVIRQGAPATTPAPEPEDDSDAYSEDEDHASSPPASTSSAREVLATMETPFDVLDAKVQGLAPGVSYLFEIAAKNRVGLGDPTETTPVRLVFRPPRPAAPTVEAVNSTTVKLSWDTPIDGGAPIQAFKVACKNHAIRCYVGVGSYKPSTRSITIPDLQKGATYTFKLVVVGLGGLSDPSPGATVKLPRVVRAPTLPFLKATKSEKGLRRKKAARKGAKAPVTGQSDDEAEEHAAGAGAGVSTSASASASASAGTPVSSARPEGSGVAPPASDASAGSDPRTTRRASHDTTGLFPADGAPRTGLHSPKDGVENEVEDRVEDGVKGGVKSSVSDATGSRTGGPQHRNSESARRSEDGVGGDYPPDGPGGPELAASGALGVPMADENTRMPSQDGSRAVSGPPRGKSPGQGRPRKGRILRKAGESLSSLTPIQNQQLSSGGMSARRPSSGGSLPALSPPGRAPVPPGPGVRPDPSVGEDRPGQRSASRGRRRHHFRDPSQGR